MKTSGIRLIFILFILLIPLTLILRKSFSTLTEDVANPSILEKVERFFDSRDRIGEFLIDKENKIGEFLVSRDGAGKPLDNREASSYKFEKHLSWSLEEAETDPLYQNALVEYAKVINDPHSTKEQIKQALEESVRINIQLEKPDEAIKVCRKALEIFPKDSDFLNIMAEVYYLKATSYQNERLYELAIENLEAILALEDLPQNWSSFTKNYLESVKKQQADASPINLSASLRYDLAEYHIRKKDFKRARQEFEGLIAKYPHSSYANSAKDKLNSLKYEGDNQ